MKKWHFLVIDSFLKILFVLLLFVFIAKTRSEILIAQLTSLPVTAIIIFNLCLFLLVTIIYFVLKHFINKWFIKHNYQSLNKKLISLFKTKPLVTSLISFFTLFSLLILIVLGFQRKLMYIPNHNNDLFDSLSEEYLLVNLDDKYYGLFKYEDTNKQTIIHFMGNHENSARLFNNFKNKNNPIFNQYNMIIVDYPNYGKSKGKLNEESLFELALLTYDYLIDEYQINPSDIIISGFSIGTGPASFLAQEKQVEKLILFAPYTSMNDIFNSFLPIFYGPMHNLILDKYDNLKNLSTFNGQVLIVASHDDEVIKYRLSKKLSIEINATLISLNNLTHNQIVDNYQAINAAYQFLKN